MNRTERANAYHSYSHSAGDPAAGDRAGDDVGTSSAATAAGLGRTRTAIAAITTGVLGLGYVVGIGVYLVAFVRQAGRVLEPVLLSRGLSMQADVGVGQSYRGQVEGRTVQVSFVPGRALDRSLLNVYVSADAGTRAAIGVQRPLLDCQECPLVDWADLTGLQAAAEDEGWVRRWLSAPEHRAVLEGMLGAGAGDGTRELYVQPERLWLRARLQRVDPSQVSAWLDALLLLAREAEG